MTLRRMKLIRMTFNRMTLIRMENLNLAQPKIIFDTQLDLISGLRIIIKLGYYAEHHYAERHYAEHHYAERQYAERHSDERHSVESNWDEYH